MTLIMSWPGSKLVSKGSPLFTGSDFLPINQPAASALFIIIIAVVDGRYASTFK